GRSRRRSGASPGNPTPSRTGPSSAAVATSRLWRCLTCWSATCASSSGRCAEAGAGPRTTIAYRGDRSAFMTQARRASMGNWQLDPYHTQVEFSAKHLGMMTVRGYFDEISTTADIDVEHPETASVEATISTASIRTN